MTALCARGSGCPPPGHVGGNGSCSDHGRSSGAIVTTHCPPPWAWRPGATRRTGVRDHGAAGGRCSRRRGRCRRAGHREQAREPVADVTRKLRGAVAAEEDGDVDHVPGLVARPPAGAVEAGRQRGGATTRSSTSTGSRDRQPPACRDVVIGRLIVDPRLPRHGVRIEEPTPWEPVRRLSPPTSPNTRDAASIDTATRPSPPPCGVPAGGGDRGRRGGPAGGVGRRRATEQRHDGEGEQEVRPERCPAALAVPQPGRAQKPEDGDDDHADPAT